MLEDYLSDGPMLRLGILRMKTNLYTLTVTFGLALYLSVSGSRFCQWSNETAEVVSSCPQNRSEMVKRAKIKNCERIAKIQNCTVFEMFKYHCVINELETAFVEVCAPTYYVHGYCTEYNSLGTVIQEHFPLKCSDVKPPCNSSYLSTDAYLFKGCNKMVIKNTQMPSTNVPMHPVKQITNVNHLSNEKSDALHLKVAILVLAFVFGSSVWIIVVYITRRPAPLKRKTVKDEEFSLSTYLVTYIDKRRQRIC